MAVRSRMQAALGAGGIVLVLPLALVLAVLLTALVAGSSVNGLEQVLAGPRAPGTERERADLARAARVVDAGAMPAIPPSMGRPTPRPPVAGLLVALSEDAAPAGPAAADAVATVVDLLAPPS